MIPKGKSKIDIILKRLFTPSMESNPQKQNDNPNSFDMSTSPRKTKKSRRRFNKSRRNSHSMPVVSLREFKESVRKHLEDGLVVYVDDGPKTHKRRDAKSPNSICTSVLAMEGVRTKGKSGLQKKSFLRKAQAELKQSKENNLKTFDDETNETIVNKEAKLDGDDDGDEFIHSMMPLRKDLKRKISLRAHSHDTNVNTEQESFKEMKKKMKKVCQEGIEMVRKNAYLRIKLKRLKMAKIEKDMSKDSTSFCENYLKKKKKRAKEKGKMLRKTIENMKKKNRYLQEKVFFVKREKISLEMKCEEMERNFKLLKNKYVVLKEVEISKDVKSNVGELRKKLFKKNSSKERMWENKPPSKRIRREFTDNNVIHEFMKMKVINQKKSLLKLHKKIGMVKMDDSLIDRRSSCPFNAIPKKNREVYVDSDVGSMLNFVDTYKTLGNIQKVQSEIVSVFNVMSNVFKEAIVPIKNFMKDVLTIYKEKDMVKRSKMEVQVLKDLGMFKKVYTHCKINPNKEGVLIYSRKGKKFVSISYRSNCVSIFNWNEKKCKRSTLNERYNLEKSIVHLDGEGQFSVVVEKTGKISVWLFFKAKTDFEARQWVGFIKNLVLYNKMKPM